MLDGWGILTNAGQAERFQRLYKLDLPENRCISPCFSRGQLEGGRGRSYIVGKLFDQKFVDKHKSYSIQLKRVTKQV